MPLFSKSSTKCLGIDIGATSIKVVEIAKKEEKLSLNNYGIASIEDVTGKTLRSKSDQAVTSSKSAIAETIEKILKEAGIKTKKTVFSIPDYSSFFTSFEVPKMKRSEVESAIHYQARQRVPLPLNEVTLDWTLAKLREKDDKELIEVLLLAVPNDIIKAYRAIADKVGLKVGALDAEVFGLAKLYSKDGRTIAVVDVGDQSTTVNIIKDGVPKHSHSINVAGKDFTKEIAILPEVDYNRKERDEENEDEKEDQKESEEEMATEVSKKIKKSLSDELSKKIKRVCDSYEDDGREEIDDIIIIGGGINFDELNEALIKNNSAVLGSPFNNIDYPSALEPMMSEDLPSLLSVATGMALEGLKSEK